MDESIVSCKVRAMRSLLIKPKLTIHAALAPDVLTKYEIYDNS